jgi:hypothetical protein
MRKIILSAALCCIALGLACAALDTGKVDELTGLRGKLNQKEGVYRITFPRDEVKITVAGWTMPPFVGLGTWAAFTETKNGAMVMGDTVLFEDEVNPVMSVALDNGLSVTALHNHFFFDHPNVTSCTSKAREQLSNSLASSEGLRQDQRNPGGQSAVERLFRHDSVAREKLNLGRTIEQDFRNER